MSLKPEFIEELSIQIAASFTKEDLDRIMATTTRKGLFEAWTGDKDSVQKTAFDLMQEVRRQGSSRGCSPRCWPAARRMTRCGR